MNRPLRSTLLSLLCGAFLLIAPAYAKKGVPAPASDPQIEQLKKEIAALESLKMERLDQLEKKEAQRWQTRYGQNLESQSWEDRTRQLEARYSRFASDLARVQEEVIKEKNRTAEALQQWESVERQSRAFELLIAQELDRRAETLSEDLPFGVNERIAQLSRGSAALEGKKKKTDKAMQLYFDDQLYRIGMSLDQTLEKGHSYFPSLKRELPIWRLRLGTLFAADLSQEGESKVQALFRTGVLRGRTFAWRDDLDTAWTHALRASIESAVAGEPRLGIAFDLMQNRGSGSSTSLSADAGKAEQFLAWAKKGGLVMYPMALIALFSLLLILERTVTLLWRRYRYRRMNRRVLESLRQAQWDEAIVACGKGVPGLSRTLIELIRLYRKGSNDRQLAEQSVQRALVVEMPTLEKRMGLLATMGAVAPLLGLLGTVSGMITLFKVITEVGSNDARLLAGGISEALITTETGLIIAIPILLCHGWLSERVDDITATLRSTILETLNILWPGGDPEAVRLTRELRDSERTPAEEK